MIWHGVLVLLGLALAYFFLSPLIKFALIDAVWTGVDRKACLGPDVGACWAYVAANLYAFIYGPYPPSESWRIDLVVGVGATLLAALLIPPLPFKKFNAFLLIVVFPVCTWLLVAGYLYDTTIVKYPHVGGLALTIIAAFLGGAATVLLGTALGFARASRLPLFRWLAIAFIEFWRAIPAIVTIFAASIMMPLFVPEDMQIDKLVRMTIALALISSPYLADEVGLAFQGQSNAWRGSLPTGGPSEPLTKGANHCVVAYALPGSIHVLIDVIKNTTVLTLVGVFDLLGMIQVSFVQAHWASPTTAKTAYLFAVVIFLCLCFPLSWYARYCEGRIGAAKQ